MARIRAKGSSRIEARFDEVEADVLRNVVGEYRSLLEQPAHGDRILERLFPDAYEAPQEAAKYHELVHDELVAAKQKAAATVAERLGPRGAVKAAIPREEAEAWLTALTDIRLSIGTRLDVTDDKMEADLDPDDPIAPQMAILHWLGWLQESIIQAIGE